MTGVLLAAVLMTSPAAAVAAAGQDAAQGSAAKSAQELRREKLRHILEEFRARGKFPGAVAGVYFADGTSLAAAVGFADRTLASPMPESALLHAGSVGKTFFAALALQLVGEGRLGLDDLVSRYLGAKPWYATIPNHETITVRMLMNHTTGIPGYGGSFMRSLIQSPGRKRSPLEAVQSVSGAQPLFPAGTAFAYTDVNYQLLQILAEKVTRRPAYREIQRRLLGPLHLSGIVPANRRSFPGLVPGYAGKDSFMGFDAVMKNGKLILDPTFEGGGGGFFTRAEDLARWMALFAQGQAFPPSLLAEAQKCVPAGELDLGSNACSGLGMEIFQTPLGIAYGHGGFFPGYVSGVLWYPERGIAVAIQVNSSAPDAFGSRFRDLFHEVAGALTE